jgi:hypothetical protein
MHLPCSGIYKAPGHRSHQRCVDWAQKRHVYGSRSGNVPEGWADALGVEAVTKCLYLEVKVSADARRIFVGSSRDPSLVVNRPRMTGDYSGNLSAKGAISKALMISRLIERPILRANPNLR